MAIRDKDDYLHLPRPETPFWNESGWFSFMVPERDLSGWIYLYHRPNVGYTVAGIAAWDPTGAETYDCLVYDWGEPYALAGDAEMFNFSIANGLTVELLEPLKRYRFSYQGRTAFNADVGIDLVFTATRPPHDAGMPGGLDEWGKGHYDQPGRMTGFLNVDGETIDVDCVAQRDRSWGIRNIERNPRGQFVWAVNHDPDGPSFHANSCSFLAPDVDPVIGTAEDIVIGYYLKDGRYGDLGSGSGGTVAVTERDATGRPVSYRVEATDSLGRRLEATGRVRNMLNWQGYSWLITFWSLVEWEFDGQKVMGEGQDYWPLHHSRTFLRNCASASLK